jgi:hypothetical protein
MLVVCASAYACAAVLFTWPLALHFSTKLTGQPGSDLGVYVWNLWVFRHEILAGRSPLTTTSIFSLDTPVDLSLHNYTIFSDLVAVPLQQVVGIVASHNSLVLFNLVVAALAMFLLAHHVVRRPAFAWLAGLLFGFSPMLMARSEIHPSLSAAAPLPLFVLALLRLEATHATRWAVALGAIGAWAAVCDPYYAVYCGLLAGWFLWTRAVRIRRLAWTWRATRPSVRVVDGIIAALVLVVAAIVVSGGMQVRLGTFRVGLTTLYTPNLLLTIAVLLRVALTVEPKVRLRPSRRWGGLVRLLAGAGGVGAALLSPILYALALRWLDGRFVTPPMFWRTSTPGADLITLLLPNPNHPWLGAPWRAWLTGEPGGFVENVTSITVVAAVVILAAIGTRSFRVPRFWGGLAVLSASLTLGPFVRVAGVETFLPTPWTILRYVPGLGAARSPARFAVLLALAASVLFAMALQVLAERRRARGRVLFAVVGAALVVELCPAPQALHDGTVPEIYARIARDPRDVRVLELPFGVRDGLSSFGNFSAASQFNQTIHGKRLIGGYLSRVSSRRVENIRRRPVLAVLMALSEGRAVTSAQVEDAMAHGPTFVRAASLAYVVMDRTRTSAELVDAAMVILDLEKIGQSGTRELYRPRADANGPAAVIVAAGLRRR